VRHTAYPLSSAPRSLHCKSVLVEYASPHCKYVLGAKSESKMQIRFLSHIWKATLQIRSRCGWESTMPTRSQRSRSRQRKSVLSEIGNPNCKSVFCVKLESTMQIRFQQNWQSALEIRPQRNWEDPLRLKLERAIPNAWIADRRWGLKSSEYRSDSTLPNCSPP
jgi:hypothetical protein